MKKKSYHNDQKIKHMPMNHVVVSVHSATAEINKKYHQNLQFKLIQRDKLSLVNSCELNCGSKSPLFSSDNAYSQLTKRDSYQELKDEALLLFRRAFALLCHLFHSFDSLFGGRACEHLFTTQLSVPFPITFRS